MRDGPPESGTPKEASLNTEIVERNKRTVSPEPDLTAPELAHGFEPLARSNTSKIIDGGMLGPYQILDLLGEGGGGRVYRAVHTRLDRQVAIKVLRSEHATKTNLVRRFFQEALAANQIQHENIVEITDLVTDELGRSYIIMELLVGESLEDLQQREGILPLERSLNVARQVCSALEAAHEAGIVHRDLKPGNVFLTERGTRDFVKLLDFGVAKLATGTDLPVAGVDISKPSSHTQAGSLLGTPDYMSPEQANGEIVDFRADIYSLGVMLYEMVTGMRPFSAKTLEDTLENHRSIAPPDPSSLSDLPHVIPGALETIIIRMMAKDPSDRPDISEVSAVIRSLLPTDEVTGTSPVVAVRSRRSTAALAAFALGILTAAIGFGVYVGSERSTEVATAPKAPSDPTAPIPGAPSQAGRAPPADPSEDVVRRDPPVAKVAAPTPKKKNKRRFKRKRRPKERRRPLPVKPKAADRNEVVNPF